MPSLKFHCQPLRVPVLVSLNWTLRGAVPVVTLLVKFAMGGCGLTVIQFTTCLVLLPLALLTVSVTVNALDAGPAFVKVCVTFCMVKLPVPSLKFHCHPVTLPIDVSLN